MDALIMATYRTAVCKPPSPIAAGEQTAKNRTRRAQEAAALIKYLSNPTRLQVLGLLADGERTVAALREALGLATPTISPQLAILRNTGMIVLRRQRHACFYSLSDRGAELAKIIAVVMGRRG
jgi:DNA-binding transcriptional ArsR family regulator